MSEQFQGEFIESADIMGSGPITLTIKEVLPRNTVEDSQKRLIDKPILVFEKAAKKFIVNKTNEKILRSRYGKNWSGNEVTLIVTYLKEAFGELNVPAVRVQEFEGVPLPFSVRRKYGSLKPLGGKK